VKQYLRVAIFGDNRQLFAAEGYGPADLRFLPASEILAKAQPDAVKVLTGQDFFVELQGPQRKGNRDVLLTMVCQLVKTQDNYLALGFEPMPNGIYRLAVVVVRAPQENVALITSRMFRELASKAQKGRTRPDAIWTSSENDSLSIKLHDVRLYEESDDIAHGLLFGEVSRDFDRVRQSLAEIEKILEAHGESPDTGQSNPSYLTLFVSPKPSTSDPEPWSTIRLEIQIEDDNAHAQVIAGSHPIVRLPSTKTQAKQTALSIVREVLRRALQA
jgi:hypothetical protein